MLAEHDQPNILAAGQRSASDDIGCAPRQVIRDEARGVDRQPFQIDHSRVLGWQYGRE
jgi:hypothetical protein